MVALRRDLHEHPELSGVEERSALQVERHLRDLGLHPRRLAGTGVVVELPGPAGVPMVGLRADLDALPIQEETGLPFSSRHPGVMHACGHDGHSAALVGAAHLLLEGRPLPAPVRLFWQPSEERGNGAPMMIEAGVLEGLGAVYGLHLDRLYPVGAVAIQEGPVNASADAFRITIHGRASHAGRPHEGLDAIVIGALLVSGLQTLVSRHMNPAEPAVLSVGTFHAGSAPNIVAGRAELSGTIRALHGGARSRLHEGLRRACEGMAAVHGAQIDLHIDPGPPAVINRPLATALAREAADELLGLDQVLPMKTLNMGAEDFAFYLDHVPGAYIRLGGRKAGVENPPAHSGRFDFDEDALATGAAWLDAVARKAGAALAAGRSLAEPITP
jgi:amidohydrolase